MAESISTRLVSDKIGLYDKVEGNSMSGTNERYLEHLHLRSAC